MSDTQSPFGTITARLEERILQPLRLNAFARRTQLSVTVALILALYASGLGWLLWRDASDPPRPADTEETPVELVAAMPQAPAPEQHEPEKPANSAPRAPNDAVSADAADKETRAPRATERDRAAAKPDMPSDEAAAPAVETKDDKPEVDAPRPPDVLDKDAEALDRLPPEPPKKVAAKTVPKPPRRPKAALQQLAGASDLPDYTFAKPMRKRARVTGGNEDDRYLAVVYGMIMQNRRQMRSSDADGLVALSFVVDGGGNLLGVEVTRSSGYTEVDAAAVRAVEEAAPFPAPPSGGTTGLMARLPSLSPETMAGDR